MNTPKNEPSSLMKKLRNATAVGALALATTFTSCDKKAPQNNSKEYEILIDDESNTVKGLFLEGMYMEGEEIADNPFPENHSSAIYSDGKKVYKRRAIPDGADGTSRIYYEIKGVKPSTDLNQPLDESGRYYTDGNDLYTSSNRITMEKIQDADPATFTVIDDHYVSYVSRKTGKKVMLYKHNESENPMIVISK